MRNSSRKKWGVFVLIFALIWGIMEPASQIGAETGRGQTEEPQMKDTKTEKLEMTEPAATDSVATEPAATVPAVTTGSATTIPTATATPEVIEITPFSGQWKYFGQKRTFIKDEHYSVSNDLPLDEGVSIALEKEEVGTQKYVVVDERKPEEKAKKVYRIKDADKIFYEIKPYYVLAGIGITDEDVNCKDRESLEGEAKNIKTLTAPENYRISPCLGENAKWGKEMQVTLQEGNGSQNEFSYYLSSMQEDSTRGAIDQTEKKVRFNVDWTAPQITSVVGETGTDVSAVGKIAGSEAGKFYYIVLPKQVAEEEEKSTDDAGNKVGITTSYIKNRVASHYGIVGYGRVDGIKATDISFSGLMPETEYVIYSYMEDEVGNESLVVHNEESFSTEKIALAGTVDITGTMAIDETLTAKAVIDSVAPGDISYQWYRRKNAEDNTSLDEVWDETGGADADDLEAELDDDEEDDEDDDDDDTYELDKVRKLAQSEEDDSTVGVEDATIIKGATQSTYKITKEDIGYRLICQVQTKNCSGYIAGETKSFVPKLIPEVTLPVIPSAVYSPKRTLASIKLPDRWSWVDDTIVPVYGNSGYRAKFVPEDTTTYRTVIVRIKVPVTKKLLAKKMLTIKKTHAYTGKAIKDNFYLEDGDNELVSRKDFKATYRNNKKLGKAYITIKGIGNYKGTIKANYKIVKCSVKSLKYKYSKKKVYTGKTRTAGVVIKNGSVKLKKNKDYTIQYKNNQMIGNATIIICGKGNYKGKKILHFQIVPTKPKIVKVTKKKTSFRLTFSKNKQVSGYRVYVSTSKAFAKKKTQQYVTTGNRFGMYSLAPGTYYVRIKSYGSKKGKNYDSSYSSRRKIKIKK